MERLSRRWMQSQPHPTEMLVELWSRNWTFWLMVNPSKIWKYSELCILVDNAMKYVSFVHYLYCSFYLDKPNDGSDDNEKLIVVTDSQVVSIKLYRCNRITSCSECVALQDPYCAWDRINGRCASQGAPSWSDDTKFYQNVQTGMHPACPSGKITFEDRKAESKDSNSWSRCPTAKKDHQILYCYLWKFISSFSDGRVKCLPNWIYLSE